MHNTCKMYVYVNMYMDIYIYIYTYIYNHIYIFTPGTPPPQLPPPKINNLEIRTNRISEIDEKPYVFDRFWPKHQDSFKTDVKNNVEIAGKHGKNHGFEHVSCRISIANVVKLAANHSKNHGFEPVSWRNSLYTHMYVNM